MRNFIIKRVPEKYCILPMAWEKKDDGTYRFVASLGL